jgi:hypothetical protein
MLITVYVIIVSTTNVPINNVHIEETMHGVVIEELQRKQGIIRNDSYD